MTWEQGLLLSKNGTGRAQLWALPCPLCQWVCPPCVTLISLHGMSTPIGALRTLHSGFFPNPTCPVHMSWQNETIFFLPFIILCQPLKPGAMTFNTSRISFTPEGGVELHKHHWDSVGQTRSEVISDVQYPGLERWKAVPRAGCVTRGFWKNCQCTF